VDPIAGLGLTLRRPTLDDVEIATRLFERVDLHDTGSVDTDVDETRDEWRTADLANDHWLVTDADGAAVGYGEVRLRRRVHLEGWVAVDPAWRRQGIGTQLADLVEARAQGLLERTAEGARVTLEGWVDTSSEAGVRFLATRGMTPVRRFWRMRIDLPDEAPVQPPLPDGIAIRTLEVGVDERATWEASEDAFAEFHRRERRTVALGVDAESLTGATRLYERAGMRVDRVYELSIRVLREGESLETA
jgi:GNAT superfamily N-acetyltransferase